MTNLKRAIRMSLKVVGLNVPNVFKREEEPRMPPELSTEERAIITYVKELGLSMGSHERLCATLMAAKHVVAQSIEGDFVECGVWRGGNALIAAAVFKLYGSDRKVYLFDTFAGMTAPTEKDVTNRSGLPALAKFQAQQRDAHNDWCYASLEDVKRNFEQAGLLSENLVFVKGDVLGTLSIESNLPNKVCVLRLDTDWYESTKKELEVLYPRLSVGGVLLIDDYGHWAGSKEATDEYFDRNGNRPFLQCTDKTARAAVRLI